MHELYLPTQKVGRVCIWGKFELRRLYDGASLYIWGEFVNVASRPYSDEKLAWVPFKFIPEGSVLSAVSTIACKWCELCLANPQAVGPKWKRNTPTATLSIV